MRLAGRRTVLLLALVAFSPSALAAWGSEGSVEPDTSYDRAAHMWADAPGDATDRVYFSVVSVESAGRTGPSPNVAALGTSLEAQGMETFEAFLGVWVDCNRDGYIGLAEAGVREYRADLAARLGAPVDPALCPAGSLRVGGGWVTEMLPVGTLPPKLDDRYIQDPAAKVWGDDAAPRPPDAPATSACGQSSVAFGAGQSRHTGGILDHVDCLDGRAPWYALAMAAPYDPTGTAAKLGAMRSLYADGGPLDKPTFGTDDSRASLVAGEQDCSRAPLVAVAPGRGVRAPGRVVVDPAGTIPATANETREESVADDCNPSNDPGHDFYGQIETSGPDGVPQDNKTTSDFAFQFHQMNNRGACAGATGALCGEPSDLGAPGAYGLVEDDTSWRSVNAYPAGHTRPGKTGLERGSFPPQPDVAPAEWLSFYAQLGNGTGAFPGAPGVYGAELCGSIGANAPLQNGWNCDPGQWNLDPLSGAPIAGASQLGTVGDAYQLRDVDCYDSTLVGPGVAGVPVGPRDATPLTDPAHGCA